MTAPTIERLTQLSERFAWRGRTVRWARDGSGPPVIFCHGTPWSSQLWAPFAAALRSEFTTYLWDMPGYGDSSKHPDHDVSLDIQGELLTDLLAHWELKHPHVVAHDYGGAVALRARLLHDATFASLTLVDVVALAPWGSPFFRLVRENSDVFIALPPPIHEGVLRAYISGASHRVLASEQYDLLTAPWVDEVGQAAFYRQIAQADESYTDEIEPRYGTLDLPVQIIWGRDDMWIPIERAHRLAAAIPNAQLEIIDDAGHLIQLDQPAQLATTLHRWLTSHATAIAARW